MISEELKRQHPTKDSVLELIHDISYDYDGYESINGLKDIIDELVELAAYALTLKR